MKMAVNMATMREKRFRLYVQISPRQKLASNMIQKEIDPWLSEETVAEK